MAEAASLSRWLSRSGPEPPTLRHRPHLALSSGGNRRGHRELPLSYDRRWRRRLKYCDPPQMPRPFARPRVNDCLIGISNSKHWFSPKIRVAGQWPVGAPATCTRTNNINIAQPHQRTWAMYLDRSCSRRRRLFIVLSSRNSMCSPATSMDPSARRRPSPG